jgi:hypothetical protein
MLTADWGRPNRDGKNRFSVDNKSAGLAQLQPGLTVVLDEKPIVERGSEVTYRVSDGVCHGGDPVQEFARFVTSGAGSSRRSR